MQFTWFAVVKWIFKAIGIVTSLFSFITLIRSSPEWWPQISELNPQTLSELGKPLLLLMAGLVFIILAENITRYIRKVCGLDGRSYLKKYKGLGYMVNVSRVSEVYIEADPFCWKCKLKMKAPNKGARFDHLHYSCGRCGWKVDLYEGELNLNREHVKSIVEKEVRSWNVIHIAGVAYRALKGLVALAVITLVSVGVLVQSWMIFLERF